MADLSTLGLGGQIPGQTSGLEQLATMIMANNQPRETAPRMITAGGQVLGRDVTPQGGVNAIAPALNNLAQNYLMMQQIQKRNNFMKSINDIMGSNSPVDDSTAEDGKTNVLGKKSQLLQVLTTNPDLVKGTPLEDVQNTLVKELGGAKNKPFSLNQDVNIPEGMKVTGYDQKGQPMIREAKVNVAEKKFEIAQKEKQQQVQDKTDFIRSEAQDTLNTISEIEKGIDNFGLKGEFIPKKLTAGTPFYNWKTNLDKLLSKKMIDLMVKMKEASKTGATGFGQLSEKEGEILRNASTAIKPGLSKKDAQRYLNDMKIPLQKILSGSSTQSNTGKTSSGMGFTISR